jgi:hypothetical protein
VLPILNGAFNFVGIQRISVINITAPKAAAGLSWSYAIELCEYNPMKAVPVGPPDPDNPESESAKKAKLFGELVKEAAAFGVPK